MDDVRQLILQQTASKGETLASASKKIGKNHAYLQQFVKRGIPAKLPEDARRKLAAVLSVDETALGAPEPLPPISTMPVTGLVRTPGNAQVLGPIPPGIMIPLYGQASAGKDGEFPWNGEPIQPVMAPPSLNGVRDAYAVLVAGDSMIPKYRSGDTVFVHPHRPAHRGDFVVVQIEGDEGQPPLAYVKRFVSLDLRMLRLEQLNPRKVLTFPAKRVKTVDRIIGNEEG